MSQVSKQVPFGFQNVAPQEKTQLVKGIFERVAPRYDLMNDVMSGGLHRLWKNDLMGHIKCRPGMHVVDVAGGTGDVSFRLANLPARPHVTIVDINPKMLEVGRQRAKSRKNIQDQLTWVEADATVLPLESQSVDAYTIVFGLRNVTDIEGALKEAYRILKPGGQYLCMEFSRVLWPLLAELYQIYSFKVIPIFGEIIAKDRQAYQYLVESIDRFPPQEEFAEAIRHVGFEKVSHLNYLGGIVALHKGWKI